jgi:AraC family transcriptional regulator, transcriptional activator of pobA
MTGQQPHNFDYHDYLKKILGSEKNETSLFIATEKDFEKGSELDFPYRSYFFVFGLFHEGNRRMKIGINEYDLKAKTLTMVGPGIVRHWKDSKWGFPCHTFFFQADFFEKPFSDNFLMDYPFFKPAANHSLDLNDADYEKVQEFIQLLEAHRSDKKIAQGLLFAFLEFVNQIYAVATTVEGSLSRNQKTTKDFNQWLNKHFQEHKEVTFYAQKLNLTPKNLSEILKNETGLSAKQMIDEFMMFEAKSLLKQTQMSIKEIVYWLGYEDASYFTKYFKTKEGITPLAYRNQ